MRNNHPLICLFILLFLSGCISQTPLPELPTLTAPLVETPKLSFQTVQPTPKIPTSTPAKTEPPARFTFPTQAVVPISKWRPPLYPVPWSLNPYDHFYFVRPIAADEVNWPEADYRYGGTFAELDTVHSGIDIDASRYTPVLAAGSGRVIWAGYGLLRSDNDINDPYGIAIAIEHDFGFKGFRLSTVYAHLDRTNVTIGQNVETGDQLGVIGLTGATTGPHLHFEVRFKHGDYYTSRNPELWLAPPQGWGVLAARLLREDGSPIYSISVYVRNLDTRQLWEVKTYGPKNVRSDDYWQENMVISDLPAGSYEMTWEYKDVPYKVLLKIKAGTVSFFSFREGRGVNTQLPPQTSEDWLVNYQK